MLKKILIVVGLLVVGFLIYVAVQPSEFVVSRELAINAKPEDVFTHINNSKKSNEWMPWAESDPTAEMVYSGPEEGIGSTTSWDSTGQMGTGKAVVVESVANQMVKTQLTYTKPMNMTQLAEISLTPVNEETVVKWTVSGKNTFIGRLFCVFFDMDKMVGDQFEKGLSNLKKIVESGK